MNIKAACFTAGTMVKALKEGEEADIPIEEVCAGDLVYSTNPETGESGYKEVKRAFRKSVDLLIHLEVGGEEIETTATHPFRANGKWTDAKDLREGDELVLADGNAAILERAWHEDLEEPVRVYNFEVEEFHTYYVGSVGVLVHNSDCLGSGRVSEGGGNADFIVTPEGVAMTTNKDFNLVSTSTPTNKGGEYLQIHNTHPHDGMMPHTQRPEVHIGPSGKASSNRVTNFTIAADINYADKALRKVL